MSLGELIVLSAGPGPVNPIRFLRERGYTVEPSDFGLWLVNGREVTQGQLVDIAWKEAGHG